MAKHIKLENAYNFRDLGGYAAQDGRVTKSGVIFRADALCRLNDADREIMTGLNIKTVFDLRADFEIERAGVDNVGEGIRVVMAPTELGVVPLLRATLGKPQGFRMRDMYVQSFASRAAYHADLFRQIADSKNHPVVIHCTAGKDRTGIVAALLLRIAGVPDDDIIADYALTATYLQEIDADQRAMSRGYGVAEEVIDEMMSSAPENMALLLSHIDDTYGSVEAYLTQAGITQAEIDQFKNGFLE